jgi:hypothetical protein
VFAIYELLRTWRQRVAELVGWAEELAALPAEEREAAATAKRAEIARRSSEAEGGEDLRWRTFDRVGDATFVDELRSALGRTTRGYRDIEAVRMTLAKHEVPRRRGFFAGAPGYGRIDMEHGSISWQIELGRGEVAVLSRRDLADGVRAFARPNDRILPPEIQRRVGGLERYACGMSRVKVTLDDGTEYGGVHVAWATEVVRVEGHNAIPFDVARVADVQPDPPPAHDPEPESDLPF